MFTLLYLLPCFLFFPFFCSFHLSFFFCFTFFVSFFISFFFFSLSLPIFHSSFFLLRFFFGGIRYKVTSGSVLGVRVRDHSELQMDVIIGGAIVATIVLVIGIVMIVVGYRRYKRGTAAYIQVP